MMTTKNAIDENAQCELRMPKERKRGLKNLQKQNGPKIIKSIE